MKQTIEEDKEPEKSGQTLVFDISKRFLGSSSGAMRKSACQNCEERSTRGKSDTGGKTDYLRTVKKG